MHRLTIFSGAFLVLTIVERVCNCVCAKLQKIKNGIFATVATQSIVELINTIKFGLNKVADGRLIIFLGVFFIPTRVRVYN